MADRQGQGRGGRGRGGGAGGGGRGRRGLVAGRPLHIQDDEDDNWDDEGGRGGYGGNRNPQIGGRRGGRGGDRGGGRGRRGDRHGNQERQINIDDEDQGGPARRGPPRRNRPLELTIYFIRQLEQREPADIIMTLGHPDTDFRGALRKSVNDNRLLGFLISILARAFTCDSMPEQLNRVLTIMKEMSFLDTAASYFMDMPAEESRVKQEEFGKPIMDMITIMSEMLEKNPTAVTQTIGVHTILQMVIDGLREKSSVIDDNILRAFREFTDHKEKLMARNMRKKRSQEDKDQEQDIEGPPDDFREIDIFPQRADMQEVRNDLYLRANKIKGKYENLDHYLDVQFRLLREDFVGPLRDGVSEYIQAIAERGKSKKFQDVRMYHGVHLVSPMCGDNGIQHQLQFDVSRLRNIRWMSTKRLIYGSLVCLSPDNFRTFYFATVVDRKPELLESGLVTVHFENAHTEIKTLFGTLFTMAETTAYFESYRHVLAGLKQFHQGDLPFEKYIINCESQVLAPAYIRRDHKATFDLRPLVDNDVVLQGESRLENLGDEEVADRRPGLQFSGYSAPARSVEVLNRESWPPADLLHLDESQFKAIHTALTKEFVITQGPPGTGKTYIGLKIVKALLHNKKIWSVHPDTGQEDLRPMLIVCYTNHALDQFLEGIVKFYKGDVIRVGSRSSSEILKDYNLHNFRQRFRHARKVPVSVYQSRRSARDEMDSRFSEINKISVTLQYATTNILHEDFLQPFMGHHYQSLTYQFHQMIADYPEAAQFTKVHGFSIIVEWLGLGNLAPIVELEANVAQENVQQNQAEDMIDVEEEVDFIQEQRKLDDGDDEDLEFEGIEEEFLTRRQMKELIASRAKTIGRKAVALDVATMGEKPKGMEIGEWQTQKKQRNKMKRNVQRNLCNNDVMSDEEAEHVHDLMRMSMADKWKLYRCWRKKYCDHYLTIIDEKQDEYEAAAERYKEALMQEDKEILKCSTVIGMTTTGAARYQAILQEIKPRIVVVEEAAEVLEAHIITTLSRGCEHLILIGDHKQLKPSPTVYKLATDYNLDVSLFERMVTNAFQCDCLELQHRMRPDISQLMHHIYVNYKDHEDVKKYENVKGVSTNVYFVNHNQPETHDDDLRSHSNYFEAEYIVALCRYLLQQGYNPEQITVLTLYSGQLFVLKNLMPKSLFNGVRVTVVDNYQGEENDIILLSLVRSNADGNIGFLKIDNRVCVALSRAKKGFYVIGNFDMLSECGKSKLWRELVIDMRKKKLLGEGLLLYCQNHPNDNGIIARTKVDFEKAPEGGCERKCDFRLACGHACAMFCHVSDLEHKDYRCKKTCNKKICPKGHRCQKKCHQPCGDCQIIIEKVIPKCGHTQEVPCSKKAEDFTCQNKCSTILPCGHPCRAPCGMAHTSQCRFTVEKSWPCGHKARIFCFQSEESPCPAPCEKILDCEHRCNGTCGRCFEGRLHRPCKNDCTRILVCGHQCTSSCNRCPPCIRKCENRCIHSHCSEACGDVCQPCMEPCAWKCEHYKCTKLCHEPCNRPRCDQPCKYLLDCGHPCIGLCGEPCPTDCRECDREKVTQILFGDEDEPDARFVLLQDCRTKCIIESKAMDKYMDSMPDGEQAIILKTCPKCKTTIRKSNRYGSIINKTLQDIEDVKKRLLSSKRRTALLQGEIKAVLEEHFSESIIKVKMTRRLRSMPEPKTEQSLVALKNQIEILRRINKLDNDWKKIHGVAYKSEREKMVKYLDNFRDWAMAKREVMTAQEIDDAECELLRSEHKLKLFLHERCLKERGTKIDERLQKILQKLEVILNNSKQYKGRQREVVENCLKELKKRAPLTGLGIDDEERDMIVKAMDLPSGHWFKCPQGHVYAIGDCGGATVESRCPECNATIGGTGHRLRADNQLAQEMDNASHPAWSEQANLVNYGFDVQF